MKELKPYLLGASLLGAGGGGYLLCLLKGATGGRDWAAAAAATALWVDSHTMPFTDSLDGDVASSSSSSAGMAGVRAAVEAAVARVKAASGTSASTMKVQSASVDRQGLIVSMGGADVGRQQLAGMV